MSDLRKEMSRARADFLRAFREWETAVAGKSSGKARLYKAALDQTAQRCVTAARAIVDLDGSPRDCMRELFWQEVVERMQGAIHVHRRSGERG